MQPGNTMEEVKLVGEMKLDGVGIRGMRWNKNCDWAVGTERYAIYKTTVDTSSWY